MAPGDVLQAAIVHGGVIEGDPAGEVSHRLRPGPIREVLVPGDDTAVLGRFDKELVMEQAHGPAEQLIGGQPEGGRPGQVMKGGLELPGPESVKEHPAVLLGFVEMKLVEERIARMGWVEDFVELGPELLELIRLDERDAGEEAVFLKAVELLPVERGGHPFPG